MYPAVEPWRTFPSEAERRHSRSALRSALRAHQEQELERCRLPQRRPEPTLSGAGTLFATLTGLVVIAFTLGAVELVRML